MLNHDACSAICCVFPVPEDEPEDCSQRADASDNIRYSNWQGETLWSDADVCRAYQSHQKSREQCYIEVLAATYEIDSYSPERKYGQGLVAPCEISPDDLEAFRISQAIDEHAHSEQKQRNAYQQTLDDRTLVDMKEVRRDQTCRAQSSISACDRSCNDSKDCQYASDPAKPFFRDPGSDSST